MTDLQTQLSAAKAELEAAEAARLDRIEAEKREAARINEAARRVADLERASRDENFTRLAELNAAAADRAMEANSTVIEALDRLDIPAAISAAAVARNRWDHHRAAFGQAIGAIEPTMFEAAQAADPDGRNDNARRGALLNVLNVYEKRLKHAYPVELALVGWIAAAGDNEELRRIRRGLTFVITGELVNPIGGFNPLKHYVENVYKRNLRGVQS